VKSFAVFILLTFSTVVMASDYQCFSYNTGKQVIANSDTGLIVVKDRFGNELDVILDAGTSISVLSTYPETTQVLFEKDNDIVLIIQQQGESIQATYADDNSFRCRSLN